MKGEKENYYILLGGAEHMSFIKNQDKYPDHQFFWTCPRTSKKGEQAFIYLCSPLSRIVGRVKFIGEPFHNVGDMFSGTNTKDKWMVEIGEIVFFEKRPEITIKGLRTIFPEWGWLRFPRQNTRIPNDLLKPFLELMEKKD